MAEVSPKLLRMVKRFLAEEFLGYERLNPGSFSADTLALCREAIAHE